MVLTPQYHAVWSPSMAGNTIQQHSPPGVLPCPLDVGDLLVCLATASSSDLEDPVDRFGGEFKAPARVPKHTTHAHTTTQIQLEFAHYTGRAHPNKT